MNHRCTLAQAFLPSLRLLQLLPRCTLVQACPPSLRLLQLLPGVPLPKHARLFSAYFIFCLSLTFTMNHSCTLTRTCPPSLLNVEPFASPHAQPFLSPPSA